MIESASEHPGVRLAGVRLPEGRLSIRRAALAITGTVLGSGGLYVAIWTALGFVLR